MPFGASETVKKGTVPKVLRTKPQPTWLYLVKNLATVIFLIKMERYSNSTDGKWLLACTLHFLFLFLLVGVHRRLFSFPSKN